MLWIELVQWGNPGRPGLGQYTKVLTLLHGTVHTLHCVVGSVYTVQYEVQMYFKAV